MTTVPAGKPTAKPLLPRFPKWVGFAIAAGLTAAEGVQLNVGDLSGEAHGGISVFIALIVSVGIMPTTGTAFVAKLPVELVQIIGGLLGAVLIFQSSLSGLSSGVQTAIACVIVAAASLGLAPTYLPVV
jgi:hypothetical protein